MAALPGQLAFPASFVGTENSAGSDRGIMASLSFLHPPTTAPSSCPVLVLCWQRLAGQSRGPWGHSEGQEHGGYWGVPV